MRKKAFTLVELIVVISIMSLLMAILVPALARATHQGKAIACMSNLRQLALTAQSYTEANDGYYPMAYIWNCKGTSTTCWNWDFKPVVKDGVETIEPGILWEGEMMERIQQCPAFKGDANWSEDPFTGYNYNSSYIGGSGVIVDGKPVLAMTIMSSKAEWVKKPAECAIFGDGGYTDGKKELANKFMRSPFTGKLDEGFYGRYAGTQGYRHLGKTNIAYRDGSVGNTRQLYSETDPSGKNNIDIYNENRGSVKVGFLSKDNDAYDLE